MSPNDHSAGPQAAETVGDFDDYDVCRIRLASQAGAA
jgi:hypothetical protein